ncbi:xyloglucan endotransglucosylase protein 7-like [Miscanthus floridulus]|uniref:xyloglucan endotransglucosylase protein 7-like n=1 Tax=Miscanthus floridulus TaxID=154761 RepID=UPI0034584074
MALSSSSCKHRMVVFAFLAMALAYRTAVVALLYDDIQISWGQDTFFYMDGDIDTLALGLDHTSGSGFSSKDAYLYARFDMDIKLVSNDSAGTVATFYLTPDDVPWEYHDEVDMEFLGNVTGEPYTLHTNVYVNGVGSREQQFHLWFDPAEDFHTYSIEWNPKYIIFLVDGTPIRAYKNDRARGVPFPTWQRMRVQGSLWNADEWATQGGRVKTDWTQAPFYAYYRDFRVTPCVPSPGVAWCGDEPAQSTWFDQRLDAVALHKVQEENMVYDYCTDEKRFKDNGLPMECNKA